MKENIVYKGCERRVIVVKSASSKHFEEAHFFLRAGDDAAAPMPDLLREANRIVERSLLPSARAKQKVRRRCFGQGFFAGITAAAALSAGLWFVFNCL